MPNKRILKQFSSGVLFSIIAKILSFLTTFFLITNFGTSRELDIFITVNGFILATSAVFQRCFLNTVPYIYLNSKDNSQKSEFVNNIFLICIVISIIIFLVLFFCGNNIVKLLAPGFTLSELNKSSNIIKILSICLVINILSSLFVSFFRSIEKTNPIYVKDIIINGIILFFISLIDRSINKLPLYYVISHFISLIYLCIICIRLTKSSNISIELSFNIEQIHKYSKIFFHLAIPIFLTSGVNELKNIIDKVFASYLQGGAITALDFSYRVIGIPVNIFGGVLVTIIFAKLIKEAKSESYNETIIKLSTIVCLVSIPLSLFVLVKAELFALLLSEFGSNIDTDLLSNTMAAYSFCIFGNAMLLIMNTVFYSQGKTKNSLFVSIIIVLLNVIFNALLIQKWGAAGLALSTTIASIITYVISIFVFNKDIRYVFNIFKKIVEVFIICIPSMLCLGIDWSVIVNANGLSQIIVELLLSSLLFFLVFLISYYVATKIKLLRLI